MRILIYNVNRDLINLLMQFKATLGVEHDCMIARTFLPHEVFRKRAVAGSCTKSSDSDGSSGNVPRGT